MEPVIVADYRCVTGEGPLWHPDEGRLYWVDIPTGRLFRLDPATGAHEQCYSGPAVGGFTLQADGKLLLFMEQGAIRLWHDGFCETIVESIPRESDSRFNDVIADPEGRVFCGTMATAAHEGRLYRLDPDGSLHVVLEDVGISNGMGFTPDARGLYYTDTRARRIDLFDYDRATGEICNRRVFSPVPEGEGGPDGMTVDAEGMVWSARWNGSCVVRLDAQGRETRRITFPAKKVSCPAFGGAGYADLYITTAGGDNKEEEGAGAGALYRVDAGVCGVPEYRSRIGL
ncbi:MAG: SMP-30/gluconolactonase/LRE family protein [Chloroflexi bacterium]|nr:SMP-30/gluconolactonase/LRE family protein [Chloroflexota bacterium]